MSRFSSARIIVLIGLFWLVVLSCRTSDVIAQANPTATRTVTRTVPRPTFTSVPPTAIPSDTPPPLPPQPTTTLVVPGPAPTQRPTTRPPTPSKSATPAPPPPTADPYAGYYYKPRNVKCVTAPNTRIEGTVTENGIPKNGVRVRVSDVTGGGPSIDDFITGTDPSDFKHTCPECAGKYRLALYEGQQNAGNWWVFILDNADNLLSPGVLITTQDGGGCNSATVDFVH